MKVTFNINYRTQWGENLYIYGNDVALGNDKEDKAVAMTIDGMEHWTATVKLRKKSSALSFRFIVKSDYGYVRREWGAPHTFAVDSSVKDVEVFASWQDEPWEKYYYSSAFVSGICNRNNRDAQVALSAGNILFTVAMPVVNPENVVAICGSSKALGEWNPEKALVMSDAGYPLWSASVPVSSDFDYKFVVINKATRKPVSWESGSNRKFHLPTTLSKYGYVVDGLRFDTYMQHWRGAGVAIPVFSLRSDDDFGVGDFHDLFKMIDWAASIGQSVVQILPINDTTMTHTWTDSYPYNANSTFALHPMYLRLEAVGTIRDAKKRAEFSTLKSELNALPTVDYERVNKAKKEYFSIIFEQDGAKVLKSKPYKDFVAKNEYWLKPYAAFCALRDINGTVDYAQWGDMSTYDTAKVDSFIAAHKQAIDITYFVQYFLDKQLSEVRDYAHSRGVVLKGDIPIGISRTSADAWLNPRLFNLDCQAGAPPDDFSVMGQNWGFPTYNWEEMNKDGFQWWKNRFAKMSEYFDAYRIDHILGFFRIWEIPMDAVHGLLGTFNPALPYSPEELRNNYDFWMNVDLYTRPYIMDYFLYDFFGEYTDEVRENFLNPRGNGRYDLKPKFATQRQVVDFFNTQEQSEKNSRICDGLLGLIDEVLFIEDKTQKGHYHPRITAQFTYVYRSLNNYERWAFDRLYNDFFYNRHNDFWHGKAMWKLPPLINSTDMLVCGEDLGMIPACVPAVMNSQKILSLEIQRMPKDPKEEFANPANYPYMSVAATSTHDMSGIRGWWEEDRTAAQHFYNNMLHEGGEAPVYAEPWICQRIVESHLYSPAMLTILPLQDWLSIDGDVRRSNPKEEQINIPAISRHYWRYRMHISLESLLGYTELNRKLQNMIKSSGR